MCGIVGYIGNKNALKPVVNGLKALEYRGYDSAGIAFINSGRAKVIKKAGRVETLEKIIHKEATMSNLALGHTRWATHGAPTAINAHPHFNHDKTIMVVHNGIIENFQVIKNRLAELGYKFATETDTEVIPHLIEYHFQQSGSFEEAFEKTMQELEGAFAIVAISTYAPNQLFAGRLSGPLVLGVGNNEFILASDPTAIMEHTKKVIYLEDYEMATVNKDSYKIRNFRRSADVKRKAEELDFDLEHTQLGDFPNYMLKEIFEAPQTIRLATLGRIRPESGTVKLGGLVDVKEKLKQIERIIIVACGTSYYAGLVGEYLIEEFGHIPVEVQLASEFKYRYEPFSPKTAVIAISQSGETADTIAALKKLEGAGMLRLGVVNATGSTIARMTDAGVYCHAGPEQAVASTKAFIAQVCVLALIALHFGNGDMGERKRFLRGLDALPKKAEEMLASADEIRKIAEKYTGYKDLLYIGRRYSYPCALEGALKIKEITYIHAEGYAAGEMKHGPLAMIDKHFATFAIAPDGPMLEKTYSNIQEIKARGGPIVAIATTGNHSIQKLVDDVIYIPKTLEQLQPILIATVVQLFAYYAAVKMGKNVDRPRNLAKSVTVE